jgi:hypothetical protein
MPRAFSFVAILFLAALLPGRTFAADQVVTSSVVVKVTQRDPAAKAVIDQARALGGYFSSLTADRVVLRVPADKMDALVATAAGQGVVVDRQFSRVDQTFALGDARSRLGAREAMLEQYMALMKEASPDAVLTVERQIVALVSEIEALRGRIRYLEHEIAMARLDVSFQFRDRKAPTRGGSSSFPWLNTLNLQDLVEDFRRVHVDGRFRGALVQPPKGFAPFPRGRNFRATSPDGVIFSVRCLEHKPSATLAFWKEAMKKRMLDAGYVLLTESDLQAGGTEGYLIEVSAPLGTDDYTYMIAVFPVGGKLVLAEAAGEVARLAARREAILETMRALRF